MAEIKKINNIARTTSVPEGGNHQEQQMPWGYNKVIFAPVGDAPLAIPLP